MKTREVFRVLGKHIEPVLLELGFKPFKDPSGLFLVWTRPRKGKTFETVACQIEKWEWDPWKGWMFQALMTRSSHRGNVALCREFAEMWDLLTADEKREVEALQNAVIARCRVPTEDEYNAHFGFPAYTKTGTPRVYREASTPVDLSRRPGTGLWLRFHDDGDLAKWARMLSTWLPHVLQREAEADWAKFGHGS